MTVDITQEEMNILNLNGLKFEDVKGDVEFKRMTGMSDESIRSSYDELLNELKPVTKTSINDTKNISMWNEKGGITPFEFAVRKTDDVFDDSTLYPGRINIDETANLSKDEIEQLSRVRENYRQWKEKHPERVQNQTDLNNRKTNLIDDFLGIFNSSFVVTDDGREISPKVKDILLHEINTDTGFYDKPKETKEGKIDFWETAKETFKSDEWLPVVGGFVSGERDKKERELIERLVNGENIRPDEYQYLNNLAEKRKEEAVRGRTLGSHIAESFLPSLVRFGGEMALGGWVLKGLGLAPQLAKSGVSAEGLAYSTIKDRAVFGLKDMALTGTANTLNPLTGGSEVYSSYQERRLNNQFELTPYGDMIFKEAKEKPATAFLKAMGDTFIMFASEASGSLIGIPIEGAGNVIKKYASSPIEAYLKTNPKLTGFYEKIMPKLSELYQKTLGVKSLKGTRDFLKSATRYDGFLEEIGEEKLEDVLALTLGLNDEERSLENYIKTLGGTPDEWAVLVGAIALQGMVLSGSSHILGSFMEKNGASDDEIVEVLKSLPKEKQDEAVSQLIENDIINVDEKKSEASQKTEEIENKIYNSLLNIKQNKNEAFSVSKLFSNLFSKYINSDKQETRQLAEKLANSVDFRYNIPAEEVTLQQAAFNGSPSKHDKFLEEYIGTGEGFLAHGYGFYFAKNKDVSEGYRERLTVGNEQTRNSWKYKGKDYTLGLNRNTNTIEVKNDNSELSDDEKELLSRFYDGTGKTEDEVFSNVWNEISDEINELENSETELSEEQNKRLDSLYNQREILDNEGYPERTNKSAGQLYEVDIPENDVLLDEQKLLGDMVLQKGLVDNLLNWADEHGLSYRIDLNKTGKQIYDELVRYFTLEQDSKNQQLKNFGYEEEEFVRPDKQASELLNSLGFKGITYFGQQDGRCYVIFEDKAINIMKTYYQPTNDYNKDNIYQRTDKTKYLTDNEIEQLEKDKENFATYIEKLLKGELSYRTQIRVLEKLPSAYNKISNLKGKKVVINQEIYKKIIDLPNIYQKNHYVDRTRALKLPELISDPLYILQSTSEGNEHRYVIVTNSKGKNPGEKLSVFFEPKNNAVVVSAYDEVINISEEKKAGRVLYDKKKELSKTILTSKARAIDNSNKSITNNVTDFNPSVNKDDGTTHFQKKNSSVAPGQMSLFDSAVQNIDYIQQKLFEPKADEKSEVQTEIPEKIERKESQEKISDVGDTLLGNLKKDKKTYSWAELESMNELLRKKYLTKSFIYSLPSPEELKKQGLSDKTVAYVYLVHSKINAKPSSYYTDDKTAQKIYFDGVQEVMKKTIEFAKENNSYLSDFSKNSERNEKLFNAIFPDTQNLKPYNVFTKYPEHNKKALILGGNKFVQPLQLTPYLASDIEKMSERIRLLTEEEPKKSENKTELTGWQTKFSVIEIRYRGFAVADRKSGMILQTGIPTEELANQLAGAMYDYIKSQDNGTFTDNFEQMRNYIPRRSENQNVNPEALIEVFGFRGINFGNWTKQKERQDFVNMTYDSLFDLAELLNLPPKALSLGGKLGLAFGAQGRNRANAHFIPEYNEINLTRKSGAGSFAHEWWHALDYYFGDMAKGQDFSGTASLTLSEQGLLRPEVYEALKNIKEQMVYSPLTESEFEKKSTQIESGILRAIDFYADDIKNTFKKSKKSDEINKLVDEIKTNASTIDFNTKTDELNRKYLSLLEERRQTWENIGKLSNLIHYCEKLQKVNDLASQQKKYSKYYQSAEKLNKIEKGFGKGYWTSSTELGARAFASYILDKINEKKFTNYFLSRNEADSVSLNLELIAKEINAKIKGEKYESDEETFIKHYPADKDERKRIFSAFDRLFDEIKVREENGKTILYQEGDESENQDGWSELSSDNDSDEKLIAGSTYEEVMNKLIELNDELNALYSDQKNYEPSAEEDLVVKINILTNAFEFAEAPEKHSENEIMENAVNVYYIMQGLELPKKTIEAEIKTPQTYKELLNRHREKLEKQETEYYGYYKKQNDKAIITVMSSANSSTVVHELGHFFLDALNELARVDENAKNQLEAIDKWLGRNGEYTDAQHEKFARSFEAYLYKGKAPNSKLREVFENFKEWLRSVYIHVSQLTDKGAEISPEVEKLFDKIFASDSYIEERKEANRILREAKKKARKEQSQDIVFVDDSQLDEVQKRHKNVCYSILSKATGKSTKYLKSIFETKSKSNAIIKKREKIEELLDKADDKITTSGGFHKEWSEFFSDTGVSYDNDEVGGDFELAWQAYDTIVRGAYQNPENMLLDELNRRAEYFEREIDNADRQYKYLINEFKNGNRNSALAAVYEWLEGLDSEIKEDYENKFTFDASLIERNENFDKFEKAKHEIVKKAVELKNTNLSQSEEYQELVKSIMKELDFLQPSDKAKMTVNILDTAISPEARIDSIMDIAKTMEDVRLRNNLAQEIHKELQTTKNVKKNGRTVGKYNYKTNKIFERLRELDRLTPERANEIRLEEAQFAQSEDEGSTPEHKLYNKFLSYKANGRTFADTELMKELYDEIMKLKFIGKTAKSDLELKEKYNELNDIDELIDIVNKKDDAKIPLKTYINWFGNLESTLNGIFNQKIKEKYASEILYAETQSQAWQHQIKQDFEKETAKIYNLPEWNWDKKILDYLGEKHIYQEIRRKYDKEGNVIKERLIDRTLTRMDIIQAYIWSKNSVLYARLKNQFGEETLEGMFDLLSDADVRFAQLMMKTAQSFYPLVNRAFIQKYGLDLPKVSCYFPSTPERGTEVDLYNEFSSKSLGNGFTKARSQSETQPMDFHNPVATLYSHIEGVSKFAFMSEALDRANLRFKDTDLKRAIINKFGEDVYRTLEQNLINVTYKKEAQVFSGINKVMDNIIGNWIQANIAIKPIVGLKQLLSANNYAIDMPYMTWQTGFLKALRHPKQTIDYMMKIPYIKARFEGSYTNEFLKAQVENSAFATSKKLKDACSLFIRMGDIGAIIFGGKPYVDYLINEKGMSKEEAIKQFILSTNRSQQSSAVSSLSNFQVNMTRNPVGKLMIAFKNSPQQYVRMCGDAIVSYKNGDITLQKCAQLIFQFGYLQPFLYTMMTSGSLFRFLFSGDDDDLLNDLKTSIFDFNSNALPLFGDVYKFALNKLAYKEKYMPMNMPLTGDIENEIMKISKEDVSLSDYLEFIGYLGVHVGLGYNYKAAVSMGEGVVDIAKGDVVEGAMKAAGYTDKRAKHIADK